MKSTTMAFLCLTLLSACATGAPDHFYVLSPRPGGARDFSDAPRIRVSLKVTLPSLVDRPEMVLNTAVNTVAVLDHERWAAPLPDLVTQTLARDLETRRGDVLVADRSFTRAGDAAVKMTVDLVQASFHKGGVASIEAHWLVVNATAGAGPDAVGSESFHSSAAHDTYEAVAQALSDCLGLLADRLAAQIPTH